MAGSVRILKDSELLFKMGDPADSMYILRKGNLKVFFIKGNEEITLAHLEEGAIVGEMAFFDQKPRSASVKATVPTEVTVITKSDFDKLLQQVPKWMVTMMQSLVTRLRQTNEKIQMLEAAASSSVGGQSASELDKNPKNGSGGALILSQQRHPYQHVLRSLRLLIIALAKDGQKEGLHFVLAQENAEKLFLDLVGEELTLFRKILSTLVKLKFVALKQDPQKQPIIAFLNRGMFVNFAEFIEPVVKKMSPLKPLLTLEALDMFQEFVDTVIASGYEQLAVSLNQVKLASKIPKNAQDKWETHLAELKGYLDLKIQKSGTDYIIKINVKESKLAVSHLKSLAQFGQDNLC